MDLSQNAPVRGQTQTLIAARPSLVWDVLARIEDWPDWNPDIQSMRIDGPVQVGTTFRWKSGGMSIRSILRVVEPLRVIAWSGEAPGIRAMHVWRLSADRAGTMVWTGETFDGMLPRLFRKQLMRKLSEALDDSIVALRAECERRATESED